MSESAYVPLYCPGFMALEPVGLIDFVSFRCLQKAIYVMNSVVVIVIQKVTH